MTVQEISDTEVRVEVVLDTTIEHAFDVFVDHAHDYWPAHHRLRPVERAGIEIARTVDGTWREIGVDGSTCPWGHVLAFDANRHIALGWQITPTFGPESDPAKASRVNVHFSTEGPKRTRVTVVHDEFERHGEGFELVRAGVAGDGGWPAVMTTYADVAAQAGLVDE